MSGPYSDAFLRHLRQPSNAGAWPDGDADVRVGEAEDEDDARRVRIQLRIDVGGRIEDARFQAFGCSATLACASYVTSQVIDATEAQARTLEPEQVAAALDVPTSRRAAAALAVRALRAALQTREVAATAAR